MASSCLGRTTAEILSMPQLQVQLLAIVAIHAICYHRFSTKKDSYFHARPNIIAHYVPFLLSFIWMSTRVPGVPPPKRRRVLT